MAFPPAPFPPAPIAFPRLRSPASDASAASTAKKRGTSSPRVATIIAACGFGACFSNTFIGGLNLRMSLASSANASASPPGVSTASTNLARAARRRWRGLARRRPGARYPLARARRFFALPTYNTDPSAASQRYTPVFAGKSATARRRSPTCSCANPSDESARSAESREDGGEGAEGAEGAADASRVSSSYPRGAWASRASSSARRALGFANNASVKLRSEKRRPSEPHTSPTSSESASAASLAAAAAASAAARASATPSRSRRHARSAVCTSSSVGVNRSRPETPEMAETFGFASARAAAVAAAESRSAAISSAITSNRLSVALGLPCDAFVGTIPCLALCASCFLRRRATSSVASSIARVYGASAKRIHSPDAFLAARPIICINDRDERMNPGTPASKTATRLTWGRSRPSRRSCAPTTQSISPRCNLCNFSARRGAGSSLCNQSARIPPTWLRYPARSSQSALVSAHTNDASPRAARSRIAPASAGSCPSRGNTVTVGSNTPDGRTTMSTIAWSGGSPVASDSAAHHAVSISPGVADTNNACGTRSQNSSNVSGRLSSADGSRYPPATRFRLRDRSPPCIARS